MLTVDAMHEGNVGRFLNHSVRTLHFTHFYSVRLIVEHMMVHYGILHCAGWSHVCVMFARSACGPGWPRNLLGHAFLLATSE